MTQFSGQPNPFSENLAPNPYAAPTIEAYGGSAMFQPFSREQARVRLIGPAIGLAIAGVFWLAYMSFVLVVMLFDAPRTMRAANPAELTGQIVGMVIALVIFCLPSVMMLVGAVQLIRVRGYGWCWAGLIAAVLPCTFCLPISLPFGIWGMIALYDSRMPPAFRPGANPFLTG